MSVDYYLVSPSRKKGVQIGSDGLGGVQCYPGSEECAAFVRWAIEEFVDDVRMVNEHEYHNIVDDDPFAGSNPLETVAAEALEASIRKAEDRQFLEGLSK